MSAVSPESDGGPGELPAPVLQQLADELLGRDGTARDQALQRLQAAHPEHAAALAQAAADLAATEALLGEGFAPVGDPLPAHLGPYEVVRQLGEGAFGAVFLCRQLAPVERHVAVKVLRPGVADRHLLARFAAERQLLAALQHPAIAQVIDAGALPDGRPYIAMEYIDGTPFRRYCDERGLEVPQRVELFLALCRGVQHAHGRGIVHRDLKPSNVLVVEHDGVALPRIIDFGIAKLLVRGAIATPLLTEAGRVVGTPGYMSPEQAQGRSQEVDARADVFSLGVMLYEVLCGQLPWPAAATSGDSDPERPSRRLLRTSSDTTGGAGPLREPRRFASALRGDLDWITLKCLRADPRDRYQSVQELVLDLERHRRSEPVLAGPPSVWYRVQKFRRRHRVAVALVAGFALAAGAAVAFAVRHEERVRAEELRLVDASHRAALRMLAQAGDARLDDVDGALGLREDLLREALRLQESLPAAVAVGPEHGAVRVDTLLALAEIHGHLGQAAAGQQVAAAALTLAQSLADADAAWQTRLAAAHRWLGRFLLQRDLVDGAARHAEQALASLSPLHDADPVEHGLPFALVLALRADVAARRGDLAACLAAQEQCTQVLAARHERRRDDQHTYCLLVRSWCALVTIHRQRQDLAAARLALQRAQDLVATLPQVTDEERAEVSGRLGGICAASGLREQAIAAFAAAAAGYEALLRKNPGVSRLRLRLMDMHRSLCRQQLLLGRHGPGLDHARLAIQTAEQLAPDYEPRLLEIVDTMVFVARRVGTVDQVGAREADGWLARAEALLGAMAAPAAAVAKQRMRLHIGRALVAACLGKPVAAAQWEEGLALARASADEPEQVLCLLALVRARLRTGDAGGARGLLAEARQLAERAPAADRITPAELGRLAWGVELQAGDHEAAAAIADGLAGEEAPWAELYAAADGLRAAHVAARRAGDQERSSAWRQRSAAAYERLAAATADDAAAAPDSQVALAHGMAKLYLAEMIRATHPYSIRLRREGLAVVDPLRATAARTWWNEGLWVHCSLQRVRDELGEGELESARQRLEALAPALRSVDHWLAATEAWAGYGEALRTRAAADPAAAAAFDRAVDALAQAARLGLSRARLGAGLQCAPLLQDRPRYREIVASLPE